MIGWRLPMPGITALVGSVVSASCCALPMALLALGVTSLGPFAVLMRYRPITLGLAAAMLAGSFALVYGPWAGRWCRDGSCTVAALRRQRIVVWIAAALMAGFVIAAQIPVTVTSGG